MVIIIIFIIMISIDNNNNIIIIIMIIIKIIKTIYIPYGKKGELCRNVMKISPGYLLWSFIILGI